MVPSPNPKYHIIEVVKLFQKFTENLENNFIVCWTFIHNHIGPPMMVHSPIRSDSDFIINKMLII